MNNDNTIKISVAWARRDWRRRGVEWQTRLLRDALCREKRSKNDLV